MRRETPDGYLARDGVLGYPIKHSELCGFLVASFHLLCVADMDIITQVLNFGAGPAKLPSSVSILCHLSLYTTKQI